MFGLIRRNDSTSEATEVPTDSEETTEVQELTQAQQMYQDLCDHKCPACGAGDCIGVTARGGAALNVQCTNCGAKFWMGMGDAERI